MSDPRAFRTGREFAAWIGLVPRQNSTGGKERLGSISKQGDRYLRRLFVLGAISIVGTARTRPDKYPWVTELLGRRPAKVAAVALANKMARTVGQCWPRAKPIGRRLAQAASPSQRRPERFGIRNVTLRRGVQERRG
jgi:transposase